MSEHGMGAGWVDESRKEIAGSMRCQICGLVHGQAQGCAGQAYLQQGHPNARYGETEFETKVRFQLDRIERDISELLIALKALVN